MRFRIGDSDLLCMDWDEGSLRVVSASVSRSAVQVRSAVHVPLDPAVSLRDAQAFGAFIHRTLAEHRIRARRVVVDVARQDAVLNLMTLPKGSASELAAMVHIQIGKELPFNKDQAVIDFAIAGENEANKNSDVWVAAVRNNVVDHIQQVMIAAGLKLERIGLRPYANMVAVASSGAEQGRTLLVDLGPSMTEIDVIRDGRLVYSRAASVTIPAAGIAAPPPASAAGEGQFARPSAMDMLLVEVSRTIEAYRATDPGAKIDRIVLAGTGGLDDAVAQAFANRFGAPTVIYQAPASLHWRGTEGESAAPFIAAIGLTLSTVSDTSVYFNFIKPKQAEDERRERVRRVPPIAAAVALLVAVAAFAAYMPVRSRNADIKALTAQITLAKKDQKARQELMTQLADLEDWQKRSVAWVDTLKLLTDKVLTTNKDAYLTKLDAAESGLIKFEMVSTDEEVASRLADAADTVRDKKNQQIFKAKLGDWGLNARDKVYEVSDVLFLQIRALLPQPKSKPAGR